MRTLTLALAFLGCAAGAAPTVSIEGTHLRVPFDGYVQSLDRPRITVLDGGQWRDAKALPGKLRCLWDGHTIDCGLGGDVADCVAVHQLEAELVEYLPVEVDPAVPRPDWVGGNPTILEARPVPRPARVAFTVYKDAKCATPETLTFDAP